MSRSIDTRLQKLEGRGSPFRFTVLMNDEDEAPVMPPDCYHLIIDLRPKSRKWRSARPSPSTAETEALS